MKRVAVRFSVIAASLLALGACAQEPDTRVRSASYQPPQTDPVLRDAQSQLRTLGFYGGPVDGIWGPETATAVERFQRDQKFVVTSRLDGATMAALHAATLTDPLAVSGATNIRAVQNRLTQLGFYEGPADGVWGGRHTSGARKVPARPRPAPRRDDGCHRQRLGS